MATQDKSNTVKIGIRTLSGIVKKNGPLSVSIATFIVLIGFLVYFSANQSNWMRSQIEALQQQNQASIERVIQNTVDEAVTKALDERDQLHSDRSIRRLESSGRINSGIKSYLNKINCDHIIIAEYHNGYQNLSTSVPFCRYSVTYEAAMSSHEQLSHYFQAISVSTLMTMCQNGVTTEFSMEEVKEYDAYMYYYINGHGAVQVKMHPIEFEGKPLGMIILVNYSEKTTNEQQIVELSRYIASSIHNIL